MNGQERTRKDKKGQERTRKDGQDVSDSDSVRTVKNGHDEQRSSINK